MRRAILLILFIFLSASHYIAVAQKVNVRDSTKLFRLYLAKFPRLKTPCVIKYCDSVPSAFELDGERFAPYCSPSIRGFGTFSSGNYICTITLGAADCLVPIFTTYSKTGKKIQEKELIFGGGSDCGYESRPYMDIDSQYQVTLHDSVFSYTCDSLGNPMPGTVANYSITQTVRIQKNGFFIFGQEQKKRFNK